MRILDELARLRALAIALGILVLAYMIIEGRSPAPEGTVDTATLLFVKAIPLIVLCWMAAFLAKLVITYRRLESFEYRDASGAPITPPSKITQQGRDLVGLGFRSFGEMESRFPWQAWKRSWVLVDTTGYVFSVLGMGPSTPLCTGWPDGSFVMTTTAIPAGVRHARKSTTVSIKPGVPLQDRYRRHVEEVQTLGTGRTEPLRPPSMADYLASTPAAMAPTRDSMRAVWWRPQVILMFAVIFIVLAAEVVVLR